MMAFTGGFNTSPDQWESKATKLFGEQLSSFIKSGSLRLGFIYYLLTEMTYRTKPFTVMKMHQSFRLENISRLKIRMLKYQ